MLQEFFECWEGRRYPSAKQLKTSTQNVNYQSMKFWSQSQSDWVEGQTCGEKLRHFRVSRCPPAESSAQRRTRVWGSVLVAAAAFGDTLNVPSPGVVPGLATSVLC